MIFQKFLFLSFIFSPIFCVIYKSESQRLYEYLINNCNPTKVYPVDTNINVMINLIIYGIKNVDTLNGLVEVFVLFE